jgi:hypothetical protein
MTEDLAPGRTTEPPPSPPVQRSIECGRRQIESFSRARSSSRRQLIKFAADANVDSSASDGGLKSGSGDFRY